jgi:Zn-dependent M28 family amino/carboxypeptidase
MKKTLARTGATALAVLLGACAAGDRSGAPAEVRAALEGITADRLMEHITVLSDDKFEGRAPGTQGEELTVAYLEEQFRALGLQPGNPDGSYVQQVPLVGLTSKSTASFQVNGKSFSPRPLRDYVAMTRRVVPSVDVKGSELVFVGYGVVAPEYGWDDYKGLDVRGKTIVMLVNGPAVPDPANPGKLDPEVFKGDAMTYYGRWTYKYEIAAEKGAAAAIIVHETGPAGYPWEVVSGSWGSENFDIKPADGNMGRAAVEGWITTDMAKELFAAAGQDFDALKAAAVRQDFQPVPLKGTADFSLTNTMREVNSRNVVAKLEGSDATARDEYVVYTAHWDHLGKDDSLEGDQIYNGALDNASGTAGLIEVARAYAQLPQAPARSILFLAVTAEEQGLLGAKYYANEPLYPLAKTVANINMDGVNQWGRTEDIVIVGYGNSTLDDILEAEAAARGRVIVPDPEPEKGFFYRSDHFEFAKQGVPALYVDAGTRFIGKPEGYGDQKRAEYTANDYHKPSDEIKPDWDLSGAVEDFQLLFLVGHQVATGDRYPEWKPGTEFKAIREEMLKAASN